MTWTWCAGGPRAARPGLHRPRALLDEGQPAPASAAQRCAREGIEFECVSHGEVERVLQLFPDLERARILYTPNFAARDEYAWALEQACASRSTTPTCSPAGRSCSRAATSSSASTPASAAATTTTCAPPARAPSSACQLSELTHAGRARPGRRGAHRGTAGARRQRHVRCHQLGAHRARLGSGARSFEDVQGHRCRRRPRGA